MEGVITAAVRATKVVKFGQRQVCEAKTLPSDICILTSSSSHTYNWKGWGVIPDILHKHTCRWKWMVVLLMNSQGPTKIALKTTLLKFPNCGWINSKTFKGPIAHLVPPTEVSLLSLPIWMENFGCVTQNLYNLHPLYFGATISASTASIYHGILLLQTCKAFGSAALCRKTPSTVYPTIKA